MELWKYFQLFPVESKKELKQYLTEPDETTESLLLEDGKTQLVYVEGIGHIRLKTETEENINLSATDTPDTTSNLRLVNTGKDYMLCVVDESASPYAVKQTNDLLKGEVALYFWMSWCVNHVVSLDEWMCELYSSLDE